MKDRELLVPWVERVLMEVIEEDHVHRDDDGDYPIRMDNTIAYVRVGLDPAKNVRVQIFAPLLRDVTANPKLFEKLNQLNLALAYFRFRWNDGIVEANTELVGEAFRVEEVRVVLSALDAYASQVAGLLELPKATPWKTVMAEEAGDAQGEQATPEAADDEDDATVSAAATAGGGVVTRLTPGKRKRRAAPQPKRAKERDPDEDPPPGYL